MLWQLSTPRDNPLGPGAMAHALAGIRSSMTERDSLTLFFGSYGDTVGLFCRATGPVKKKVGEELRASYPDLTLRRLPEFDWVIPLRVPVAEAQLHLVGDLFPIASLAQFDDQLTRGRHDPVAGLLNVVAGADLGDWSRVSFDLVPAPASRTRFSRRVADRYYGTALHQQARRGAWYLRGVSSPSRSIRWATRLAARCLYPWRSSQRPPAAADVYRKGESDRWLVSVTLQARGETLALAQQRVNELAGAFGRFTASIESRFVAIKPRSKPYGFLLSCDELALLWHPPTVGVRAERQQVTGSRELQPPPRLPTASETDGVALGDVVYGNRRDEVALTREDRRKHLYVVGKTGSGKSALIENLVRQDLEQGRGVGVFDPHGELIDGILQRVPTHRTNDLVLFDPVGDTVGFNPLECRDPARRDLVASGFVTALSKLFDLRADATPRLLYILRNTVLALLEQPGASMLDIMRMLSDEAFRERVIRRVRDPVVLAFWTEEFATWTDRYRQESLPAIQNKVGSLLSSRILRRVFDSRRRSLDLRSIMDRQQVLLVNGSQGKLGQDNASVLLALLISSLEQAALARADAPPDQRPDFYAYCDEFQTYAGSESFEIILSQSRKYHLCCTLAHQYGAQISDHNIDKAVFGNVGTQCVLRVGRDDAERLAREMSFETPPELRPEDLMALPAYRAIISLSVGGAPQRPFSMATRPPVRPSRRHAKRQTLLKQSKRLASPRG